MTAPCDHCPAPSVIRRYDRQVDGSTRRQAWCLDHFDALESIMLCEACGMRECPDNCHAAQNGGQ